MMENDVEVQNQTVQDSKAPNSNFLHTYQQVNSGFRHFNISIFSIVM